MSSNWISAGIDVLGLLGVLGGGFAYLTTNYAKTTINLQRQEIQAFKETNIRLQQEGADMTLRIVGLEGQIKTLTSLVTQRSNVDALAATTAKQHQEVLAAINSLSKGSVNVNVQ